MNSPQPAIRQTVSGKSTHADAGQIHLNLNYLREHCMLQDENPPVGLILCLQSDRAVTRYAFDRSMCRNQ